MGVMLTPSERTGRADWSADGGFSRMVDPGTKRGHHPLDAFESWQSHPTAVPTAKIE
jgi:hypothetical protein